MITKTTLLLSTLIVSLSLIFFAHHGAWYYHLRSDTDGFYYPRAKYLLENGNFTGLGYNEYQPGAMFFFISLTPLLWFDNTVDTYRAGLFTLNLLIFALTSSIIARRHQPTNVLIYQAVVFFAGPIVLFRFELLMFLLVYQAYFDFQRQKHLRAGFWLGIALATKIYPILLIPYFGWLSLWQGSKIKKLKALASFSVVTSLRWRRLGRWTTGLFLGSGLIIFYYTSLFKVEPPQLLEDMSIHSQKPVHAESVWASALTLWHKYQTGSYALGKGAKGIFGIHPHHQIGSLTFYNYFWIVPLTGLLLWLVFIPRFRTHLRIDYIALLILTFLCFSKILTAQYLLWFGLLLAVIDWHRIKDWSADQKHLIIGSMLLINLMSQYVYPLKYNELLGGFYTSGSNQWIFWVLTARNGLLLFLLGYFGYLIWTRQGNDDLARH